MHVLELLVIGLKSSDRRATCAGDFVGDAALKAKISALLVGGLLFAIYGSTTRAAPLYDMGRFLKEPHPFQVLPAPPVRPPQAVRPVAPVPAARPVSVPSAAEPQSPTATPIPDKTPAEISGGVARLEFLNEDSGYLGEALEPLFDPFGGQRGSGQLTWGWRISYAPNRRNPDWFEAVRPYMPWLERNSDAHVEYTVEQFAFTPNKFSGVFGAPDRPFAGILDVNVHVGLKGPLRNKQQRVDQLDLTLGMVGPASGAEEMHEFSHDILGRNSRKWVGELKSEPFVNLGYEYGRRFFAFEPGETWNMEIMPHAGVMLGNALTYGNVGFTTRVGGNLAKDQGAPRLRYLASGTSFPEAGRYWAWSFFIGAEARYFARNITLDGNTFKDGPSVDKKPFIHEIQAGFEVGYGGYRLTVTNVMRTEEFDGDIQDDMFLRAGMSAEF